LRRRQLVAAVALASTIACTSTGRRPASPAANDPDVEAWRSIVVQDYRVGLEGVRAANPDVELSLDRDPSVEGPVLSVVYPAPTADPAGRDVWCDADPHDWSAGRTLAFRIKPDHAVTVSVSFLDRNHVVYTSWARLRGGVWQSVRVAFSQIHPNPYFQPPDAKTGAPLDVSDVKGVAFAPHDRTAGRLWIGKLVVLGAPPFLDRFRPK
jgi:hypothetical protein